MSDSVRPRTPPPTQPRPDTDRLVRAAGMGDPRGLDALANPDVICVCVTHHTPKPLELHRHHLLPLSWGGTRTPDNEVYLCPSSHASVHYLLRRWAKASGRPAWDVEKRANPYVRDLAAEGWRRLQERSGG